MKGNKALEMDRILKRKKKKTLSPRQEDIFLKRKIWEDIYYKYYR